MGKTLWMSGGELHKKVQKGLPVRRMRRVPLPIDGWQGALAEIVEGLDTKSFLIHGDHDREEDVVQVVSKKAAKPNGEFLTRSNDDLHWRGGPGTFCVDYDGDALRIDEHHAILTEVFPEAFADAGYVGLPSSGSLVYTKDDGRELRGWSGHHQIYLIDDQLTFASLKLDIMCRLCLAGHCTPFITNSGGFHLRTIIDGQMFVPGQPQFASGAELRGNDLEQRRPPAAINAAYGMVRASAIPPLTQAEQQAYDALLTRMRRENRDEIKAKREAWKKASEAELIALIGYEAFLEVPDDAPEPERKKAVAKRARQVAKQAIENHVLTPENILTLNDGTSVLVSEVMGDPERFEAMGWAFRDPLEPDYGEAKAKVFAEDRTLHSFAHGGISYKLRHDRVSLVGAFTQLQKDDEDPLDHYDDLRGLAELNTVDQEKINQWFKKHATVGIMTMRQAEKERREQEAAGEGGMNGVEDLGMILAQKVLDTQYPGGLVRATGGHYWRYDGRRWVHTADEAVDARVQVVVTNYLYPQGGDNQAGKIRTLTDEATTVLRRMVSTDEDVMQLLRWDEPPIINFMNGELHLLPDGPVLRPHNPAHRLLRLSPFDYDPEAKCPAFDAMMELTLPDRAVRRHVFEMIGYVIQPGRWLKLVVIGLGDGYNAKSPLFYDLPARLVGEGARASIKLSTLESDRWAPGDLVGALLAVEDDMKVGAKYPDSELKKFSQLKELAAEYKGKDRFMFVCRSVPVILGNGAPFVRDLTPATRERLQVIKFDRQFMPWGTDDYSTTNATRLWNQILNEELPGVVNELVDHYYQLRERGHLLPPEACESAKEDMLAEGNVVAKFMAQEYVEAGPSESIPAADLYASFEIWYGSHIGGGGSDERRVGRNGFFQRLRELGWGVDEARGRQLRVFGVKKRSRILDGEAVPALVRLMKGEFGDVLKNSIPANI